MLLHVLVVCRDPHSLELLRRALAIHSLGVEVATGPEEACALLDQKRFDGLFVDCDDMHNALGVLQHLRKGHSNQHAVAYAIVNRVTTASQAFAAGATLVLHKPLTLEEISRNLRAGIGLMDLGRRRYFRYQVDTVATLTFDEQDVLVSVTNLGEGGFAFYTAQDLPRQSGSVHVQLTLPGASDTITAAGELAWSNAEGGGGVKFTLLARNSDPVLKGWIQAHGKEHDSATLSPH
jgi:CheY-like chemotaxis protein